MTELGITKRPRLGQRRGALGLATAAVFAVGSIGAIASDAAAQAEAAEELSMEQIVDIVNALGLGEVYEVERERKGYEVKVEDPEGVRTKLFVNSKTGEVLHQKRDDDDDRDSDEEGD